MSRILVVDDESNIRLMLRLALRASGHEVETAADGPEALEKFGEGSAFDLVLLDQRMPSMEGLQVLRAMKERSPSAKVIMVTAFGTVDLALAARRTGAANFLRKPFTTDVLRGAVAAALDNRPALSLDEAPDLGGVAVNGFRLEAQSTTPQHSADGGWVHRFAIVSSEGTSAGCEVRFSPVFVELVKAHADRDDLREDDRFWLWLGEEALANFLWQNAAPPPDNSLVLEELTSNLRRWMDAVLAV